MKASDYIVSFIKDRGVDVVFGYSGGAITHLMDSLAKAEGIKFIQTYHEQTAAIAAEGYCWCSHNMGVAIATSGPGATNLLTGIADAFFDSIPTIFITGQVNTYEYKGDKKIRQQGFQETDIVSIVKPITKYAVLINDVEQLVDELEKAWDIAISGRGGPVLIDIPMDVQRGNVSTPVARNNNSGKTCIGELKYLGGFSESSLEKLIINSKRPMFLFGNGVFQNGADDFYRKLVNKVQVPVVTSLLGKGSIPENSPLSLGMIGSYGIRCANMAISNSDLVIAVGTRLDTRQTGTNLKSFVREGRIIRLDIDLDELINHRLSNVDSIVGDARSFFTVLDGINWGENRKAWLDYVTKLKNTYSQKQEIERNIDNKLPYRVMDILNEYSSDNQIYTVDIGQNQMVAAQMLIIKEQQSWKTSGGLAPMGFALPAAIGAAFASKNERNIFAIVGDGGLHMSMQSMLLIAQYKLPIKIILLNNKSLGMITQFQDLYFEQRKAGTTKDSGYMVPSFRDLAKSCGLEYHMIKGDLYNDKGYLDKIFNEDGPMIVEFDIGEKTIVYPKLEVNMPLEDASPRLPLAELVSNMIIKPVVS